jgi:hypothetical protein
MVRYPWRNLLQNQMPLLRQYGFFPGPVLHHFSTIPASMGRRVVTEKGIYGFWLVFIHFYFLPDHRRRIFYYCRHNKRLATGWLVLASLFLRLVGLSLFADIVGIDIFNYSMFGRIIRARSKRKRWLALAVIINLTALCYFKYSNFFILSINDLAGEISLLDIILPMEFHFTFTQISFLVDAYYDKVKDTNFIDYILFFLFSYIVSGPILHHKEMLPQFADTAITGSVQTMSLQALPIFVFGLAKNY